MLVGTARERFFSNWDDADWDVIQTGAGMTISGPTGGAVAGAVPYKVISSGTTANAQTVLLSKSTFRVPVDLRYQITASQRIVNSSFRIGFVEVNEATGDILTDTSVITAPSVLNARNAALQEFSSTTVTSGILLTRTAGSAIDTQTTAFGTGFGSAATGTSPNFIAATGYALSLERDRVSSRAFGLNTTINGGAQFAADRVIPHPGRLYKVVIIVENGSTAPASSSDWRIHLINLLDATRLDVSPRRAGSSDATSGFPVNITNNPVLGVGAAAIGDVGVQYRASATGAGAIFPVMSPATPVATQVKSGTGRIIGGYLINTSASLRSVKFWNATAASVTLGATAALFELDLPPNVPVAIGHEGGIAFSTAQTYAITGAKGLTDNTAISANDVTGYLLYA